MLEELYNYSCHLCNNVLLDPYQTLCGHRMCGTCVRNLLEEHGSVSCPYGESDCQMLTLDQPNPTVRQDYPLQRELKQKLVACSFKDFGCTKYVKGGEIKKHLDYCEFRFVQCENCSLGCTENVERDKQAQHSLECEYIPQTCQHCNRPKIPKIGMEVHFEKDCPDVLVSCENNCNSSKMLRKDLDTHVKSCPLRLEVCLYVAYGCTFKGKACEMSNHNCISRHLDLVAVYFQNWRENHEEKDQEFAKVMKYMEKWISQNDKTFTHTNERLKQTQKVVANQGQEILTLKDKISELNAMRKTGAGFPELQNMTSQVAILQQDNSVLKPEVAKLQEKAAATSANLSAINLRFHLTETVSYDGTLMWKITDYKARKAKAVAKSVQSLYSQPFYTSRYGYRMCARIYLNGDGLGAGSHISLFFVVLRGEYDALLPWPFRQKLSLMLLDQVNHTHHIVDSFRLDPSSTSFQRPVSDMNIASGCPMFISHAILEAQNSIYLQEDTIFIKIVTDLQGLQSI